MQTPRVQEPWPEQSAGVQGSCLVTMLKEYAVSEKNSERERAMWSIGGSGASSVAVSRLPNNIRSKRQNERGWSGDRALGSLRPQTISQYVPSPPTCRSR